MGLPDHDSARTYQQARDEYQRVRSCIEHSEARMKDQNDARDVCKHTYDVGDLLWLIAKNNAIGLRHESRRLKLLPSTGASEDSRADRPQVGTPGASAAPQAYSPCGVYHPR